MTDNKATDIFFNELLSKTDKQFRISPVYQKQLQLGQQWNYAISATPLSKGKGIIFGINWGGTNEMPQKIIPTGEDIADYRFIKQNKLYLEEHWQLDILKKNFNYTNLCFFRTPRESELTNKDYELSLPLFEEYVNHINPPWLLSIGSKNFKVLNLFGLLKNIQSHIDNNNKFMGHSAQLWNYNFFSVPHPNARLTTEARHTIWTKVTESMRKLTNLQH